MKKTWQFISIILLVLLTFLLGDYFDRLHQREKIVRTAIRIYPMNKNFIEIAEVSRLIKLKDSTNSAVKVQELEKILEENAYIENAEVYRDLNGNLTAEVAQYKPIARVLGNQSFYIDEKGQKKPLSKHYTERVVLVFGDYAPQRQAALIDLLQKINKDEQLKHLISEIHLQSNDKAVLKLTDMPVAFVIELKSGNLDETVHKLKTMHAYLVKKALQHAYRLIDLRYHNQAVCKKISNQPS